MKSSVRFKLGLAGLMMMSIMGCTSIGNVLSGTPTGVDSQSREIDRDCANAQQGQLPAILANIGEMGIMGNTGALAQANNELGNLAPSQQEQQAECIRSHYPQQQPAVMGFLVRSYPAQSVGGQEGWACTYSVNGQYATIWEQDFCRPSMNFN
jgi:hypothetical protein